VNNMEINKNNLEELLIAAWNVRENASVLGKTKVGCSILTLKNNIYVGCNVEQQYRNNDVHAEVNAISNMVSMGELRFGVIVIAAKREFFTPCGACLDWIFQFGGPDALILFQNDQSSGRVVKHLAKDLMPYYPR